MRPTTIILSSVRIVIENYRRMMNDSMPAAVSF